MKPKYSAISVLVIALVLFSVTATAAMLIPANQNAKENAKVPENSPAINEGWGLERADFIHYAKPANPGKAPNAAPCYKLLGVSWKALPANYAINPTNQQYLKAEFITSAVSAAAETWDAATSKELFSDSYSTDYDAVYGSQDFENAIVFGDYPNSSVIAVTSVWYIPKNRQIVEFDMLFNTRFSWGDASGNQAVMDLQNIATHELGHAAGLNDIYSAGCSAVTMYGYSTEGETAKRTLEQPDISGLQKMYGA